MPGHSITGNFIKRENVHFVNRDIAILFGVTLDSVGEKQTTHAQHTMLTCRISIDRSVF